MLELYTDTNNRAFEFNLDIIGEDNSELDVRLIATFENYKRNYIFFGELIKEEDSNIMKYRFVVPTLSEINKDDVGKLKLEVLSEDMYFSPWESAFVVKQKKSIKINEVNSFEMKDKKDRKIKLESFTLVEDEHIQTLDEHIEHSNETEAKTETIKKVNDMKDSVVVESKQVEEDYISDDEKIILEVLKKKMNV